MNRDITLPCEDGIVNLRVGAIIQKDGKNWFDQCPYRF